MNNFFRALLAGAAAKKFGGGCLGTIVVFAVVWVALGQCASTPPIHKRSEPVNKEKHIKAGSDQVTPDGSSSKAFIYSVPGTLPVLAYNPFPLAG
jgi:hypothetical protein